MGSNPFRVIPLLGDSSPCRGILFSGTGAVEETAHPRGRFTHGYVILNCLGQVLYLGIAPRTNETLLDFRERCRVTRHSRVFPRVDG